MKLIAIVPTLLPLALAAQSIGGPVLGYVVDDSSRLHPIYGMTGAAYIGPVLREGVKQASGPLLLLNDGKALLDGRPLEGQWASLDTSALLDASGRTALIAGAVSNPWKLEVPSRILRIRVDASGHRAAVLLEDESLSVWSTGGAAEFRVPASQWWSFAFAGERLIAYDPAANAISAYDKTGAVQTLRTLDGPGASRVLAMDSGLKNMILSGDGKALIVPFHGGEIATIDLPSGCDSLLPVDGANAFLLHRDPSRPMWLLSPGSDSRLSVIPALPAEEGARQ